MRLSQEKIRALRKSKKLTLRKLGELSGLNKCYIFELENRPYKRIDLLKLRRVANALGVTITELMEEDEKPASKHQLRIEKLFQSLGAVDKAIVLETMDVLLRKREKEI